MVNSSSWATNSEHKYDVFLSYRGADTGDNFKSHLFAALLAKNILTFADSNLCKGEDISPSLVKAIEESKLSVIIFSENYASSKWCLDEAVKIMECRRLKGQKVIPVFYRVAPSQVRHQTGSYAEAFTKHLKRLKNGKDRVQSWREALNHAANLSGWDSQATRPESELIKRIVADILTKLDRMPPNPASVSLIGIDSRIKQLESLLCIKNPSRLATRGQQMTGTETEAKLKGSRVNPEDTKGNLDSGKEKKVEIDLKKEKKVEIDLKKENCYAKNDRREKLGDESKKLGEEKPGGRLHCEGCVAQIKKIIRKIEGVESVMVETEKNLVTVKGSISNSEDLVSYLRENFKRNIEVSSDQKMEEKSDNGDGSWRKEAVTKDRGEEEDCIEGQTETAGKQEWQDKRDQATNEGTKIDVKETNKEEIKDGAKRDEDKEWGVEKKDSVIAKQDTDVVQWGLHLLEAKEGEGKKIEEKGWGVEKKNPISCKQDSDGVRWGLHLLEAKVAEDREMHGGNKDEGKGDTRWMECQNRYQLEAPCYKRMRSPHDYIYSDWGIQHQEHFRSRNKCCLDGATQMFSEENPNSCSIM